MEVERECDTPTSGDTRVERVSDVELVVTRTIDAPARLVWEAWTDPDSFRKWWVPKSFGLDLASCEMDVRVGGRYCLAFLHEGSRMEFFGTYLEVTPCSRLVWTNEEGDSGTTVTTVTFEEREGATRLCVRNRYPSKEALESDGSMDALPESLGQLEELLVSSQAGGEEK
jgi:uncharacterized protein YndB with AHSA1/START domain